LAESSGYEAVRRVALDQSPLWLGVIRACYETIEKQVAAGFDEYTCAAWVRSDTGVQVPSLRALVSWGVLQRKRWWTAADGPNLEASDQRVYYLMPDRPGVDRALTELRA
jgi:hypothetical protein